MTLCICAYIQVVSVDIGTLCMSHIGSFRLSGKKETFALIPFSLKLCGWLHDKVVESVIFHKILLGSFASILYMMKATSRHR